MDGTSQTQAAVRCAAGQLASAAAPLPKGPQLLHTTGRCATRVPPPPPPPAVQYLLMAACLGMAHISAWQHGHTGDIRTLLAQCLDSLPLRAPSPPPSLHARRMQVPDDKVVETWKAAFGDAAFADAAAVDGLVVLERPRLHIVPQILDACADLWGHLEEVSLPMLVSGHLRAGIVPARLAAMWPH